MSALGAPHFPCSSLSFSSCYTYSPRAAGAVAEASRRLCERVKDSDPLWLPRYVGQVCRASFRDPQLAALFARAAVLVPVPGSAASAGAPWAALQLAIALKEAGLARRVWRALQRQTTVRKSARAPSRERPTVREHYESFGVAPTLIAHPRVVLIDDVVTKGRTLLAAAARLQVALPHADIRAFALIRTQGFAQRLDSLFEPCHGVIRWAAGDAWREP
jgi:predicted amidophosphoribosyltransferase